MIEQHDSSLTISFPSPEAAKAFHLFLQSLLAPATSEPPSEKLPESPPEVPTPDSPEPGRSRHAVLTEERQEQLFNQRQAGQTQHQRQLRAQTTLRDGVLPFSKPGQTPAPSGQSSPRQRAQMEGGFAGEPHATALPAASINPSAVAAPGRTRLRPAPKDSLSQ